MSGWMPIIDTQKRRFRLWLFRRIFWRREWVQVGKSIYWFGPRGSGR